MTKKTILFEENRGRIRKDIIYTKQSINMVLIYAFKIMIYDSINCIKTRKKKNTRISQSSMENTYIRCETDTRENT